MPIKMNPKITTKQYRCIECNHVSLQSTNHWGEIYIRCNKCSWKSPLDPIKTHVPNEPIPNGAWIPEPWKKVKFRDIVTTIPEKKDEF